MGDLNVNDVTAKLTFIEIYYLSIPKQKFIEL
jgi:hypothetical protein